MKGQNQGRVKLYRTSYQWCLGLIAMWGPAVGQTPTPTSPCGSDAFEVQFKAVCPQNPEDVPRTFEEAKNPLLVIRLLGEVANTNQTVWASFGATRLAFPRTLKSLFALSLSDSRIFSEQGRQQVQLTYLKGTTGQEIEVVACDDPNQECLGRSTQLSPRTIKYPRCQIPSLVILPVYSGCR